MAGLRPIDYNVIVLPDDVEERTKGGVFLPEEVRERDRYATRTGVLVEISPAAFVNADWPEGAALPAIGERVVFTKYSGAVHEVDGKSYRIMKDKDVLAVCDD